MNSIHLDKLSAHVLTPAGHQKVVINLIVLGALAVAIFTGFFVSQRTGNTNGLAQGLSEDVNNDGRISLDDVAAIRETIAEQRYNKRADISADGVVDEQDLITFYDRYSIQQ